MKQGGQVPVGAAWLGAAPVAPDGERGWKSGDVKVA